MNDVNIELNSIYNIDTVIINGMSCASCSSSIESALKQKNGIKNINVNLIVGNAIIEYNQSIINIREILQHINDLGFECYLKKEDTIEEKTINKLENEIKKMQKSIYISIFFATIALINMCIMLFGNHMKNDIIPGINLSTIVMFLIATPMQFIIGQKFYINVYHQIINKKALNMDTLIILSTTFSYVLSVYLVMINIFIYKNNTYITFFESSVFIFTFVYIGKFLELKGKISAAKTMNNLIYKSSNKVLLIKDINDNHTVEIDESLININDILLIKPNSENPCDGKIILNESYIDESMLTGESKNVYKNTNSVVYGGTINVTNTIYIKALQTGNDMMINRIKRLVEDAQTNKTQLQNIIDIICKWFIYIILSISLIDFIVWIIIGYLNFVNIPNGFNFVTFALYLAVSVIVVACPCAIGLATPITVLIGSGILMSKGILLKNGADSIEKMSKIDTIVFDKTGTLTTGKMNIIDSYNINKHENFIYIDILSNITDHPLSKCLSDYLKDKMYNCHNESKTNEKIHLGKGVECEINGEKHYLGSVGWLYDQNDMSYDYLLKQKLKNWKNNGYSIVLYKKNNEILAGFAINDIIRNNAKNIIDTFKQMNINVWMLSGDTLESALKIANKVGINNKNVIAGVLPESKAEIIENIQNHENYESYETHYFFKYKKLNNKRKIIAMVGDGGNDSIALAQADIGIAMKVGSDLALSSSSVILMKSELEDVLNLKIMSNKIMNKIYINLFWSLAYNIIGIPLAAGVFYPLHINPIFAALSMSLSSVFVVINSILLKYQL